MKSKGFKRFIGALLLPVAAVADALGLGGLASGVVYGANSIGAVGMAHAGFAHTLSKTPIMNISIVIGILIGITQLFPDTLGQYTEILLQIAALLGAGGAGAGLHALRNNLDLETKENSVIGQ